MSLHIFDNPFLKSDMSFFISFKSVSFGLHLSQMNINMDISFFWIASNNYVNNNNNTRIVILLPHIIELSHQIFSLEYLSIPCRTNFHSGHK